LPRRRHAATGVSHDPPQMAINSQEAVMRQAISPQHPAVVLRSHYRQLRALLAVALVAVVGLTCAVVILAVQENDATTSTSSTGSASSTASVRPDGGPEESGVAAAIGKGQSSSYSNYWSPMPRTMANGQTYVPGQPTESAGRPDESKIAGEIDTGAEQTVPKVFQGPRFGGPHTN
jgi:hypothetical protein